MNSEKWSSVHRLKSHISSRSCIPKNLSRVSYMGHFIAIFRNAYHLTSLEVSPPTTRFFLGGSFVVRVCPPKFSMNDVFCPTNIPKNRVTRVPKSHKNPAVWQGNPFYFGFGGSSGMLPCRRMVEIYGKYTNKNDCTRRMFNTMIIIDYLVGG